MDTSQYLTTSSMSFRKYNRYLNWCMHILKWDSWQSVVVHYHVLQDQRAKMQDPGLEWQQRTWALVCLVFVTVESLEFVGKVFSNRFPGHLWDQWNSGDVRSKPGARLGLRYVQILKYCPEMSSTRTACPRLIRLGPPPLPHQRM